MRAHRALRLRVLVLVVLLHAAGLWLLLNGRGGDAAPAAVARIAVRLLPLPPSVLDLLVARVCASLAAMLNIEVK